MVFLVGSFELELLDEPELFSLERTVVLFFTGSLVDLVVFLVGLVDGFLVVPELFEVEVEVGLPTFCRHLVEPREEGPLHFFKVFLDLEVPALIKLTRRQEPSMRARSSVSLILSVKSDTAPVELRARESPGPSYSPVPRPLDGSMVLRTIQRVVLGSAG